MGGEAILGLLPRCWGSLRGGRGSSSNLLCGRDLAFAVALWMRVVVRGE